jgi:hypothetical protein
VTTEDDLPARVTWEARAHATKASGAAHFRSVRIGIQDLRVIEAALDGRDTIWRCSLRHSDYIDPDALGATKKTRPMYNRLTTFEAPTLEDLIDVPPRGRRLYNLEVNSEADGNRLSLTIGAAYEKSTLTKVDLVNDSETIPLAFHNLVGIVHAAYMRSQRLQVLGITAVAFSIAIPLLIFDGMSSMGLLCIKLRSHTISRKPSGSLSALSYPLH